MIVDESDMDRALLAGRIAGKALLYGKSLMKPDVRVVEVLDKVEEFIRNNGGEMAFPVQMAINDVAAHFCPGDDDITVFKSTDIIKLDCGVHVDGIIADNALTVIFKEDNERYDELSNIKRASEEALKNAVNYARPGTTLGEIGLIIQETISKYDLSPVKNLSGHGLGKYSVHEPPTIPNFDSRDKHELQENQLIAIEPFATNGHGMIFESSNATIFSQINNKPVRSQITREILRDIQAFQKLPFTARWLTKKHSASKVRYAINDMMNLEILHEYPPLIEVGRGMVAQSEHTVIVREKPIVTTNREE